MIINSIKTTIAKTLVSGSLMAPLAFGGALVAGVAVAPAVVGAFGAALTIMGGKKAFDIIKAKIHEKKINNLQKQAGMMGVDPRDVMLAVQEHSASGYFENEVSLQRLIEDIEDKKYILDNHGEADNTYSMTDKQFQEASNAMAAVHRQNITIQDKDAPVAQNSVAGWRKNRVAAAYVEPEVDTTRRNKPSM